MLFWSLWCCSDLSDVVLIPLILFWSLWYCSDLSDVVLIPLIVVLICLLLFWFLWCCYDRVVLLPLLLFWSLCSAPSVVSDPSVSVLITQFLRLRGRLIRLVCGYNSHASNIYMIPYLTFFSFSGPRSLLSLPSRPRQGKPQDFSSYQYLGRFCQDTKNLKCLFLDFIFL